MTVRSTTFLFSSVIKAKQDQNIVHYNCFLGFLSLLTHECQIMFNWCPHCHFCIISILKIAEKITECPHEIPEGYCWSTYNDLFYMTTEHLVRSIPSIQTYHLNQSLEALLNIITSVLYLLKLLKEK